MTLFGGPTVAIICDGNLVTQGFLKIFNTSPSVPLITCFCLIMLIESKIIKTIRSQRVVRNYIFMLTGKLKQLKVLILKRCTIWK